MDIFNKLKELKGIDYPFLVHSTGELHFNDISQQIAVDLSEIKSGDVVALLEILIQNLSLHY